MGVDHWQNIYLNKTDKEVSWTQEYPHTAMNYLKELNLPKTAKLIDIGGGASNFADAAMELGYTNITVLDISEAALSKSKKRLGEKSKNINWIVTDANSFKTDLTYDFWYDRAVFHFLTEPVRIEEYIKLIGKSIEIGGHFLLGTFSENGPKKCSGLEIVQYSELEMKNTFSTNFKVQKCFKELHSTPFDTIQEFQFCGFIRL